MKDKKVKLLLVTPYFPPQAGGLENYAFHIAQGLMQTYDYEVVVVTSNPNEKKQIVEDYYGIRVYRLPILFRVANTPTNPFWYFTIKGIIQREKPDIINSHQPVPFIGDLVALLAGDIPFVLTYHSGTMKKKKLLPDIIIALYEGLILPSTARKATRIICASNFVRKTILKKYAYKCTVIHPGVDIALFKENPAIKKDKNLVLFVCHYKSMHKIKGLGYLLDAIKMLPGINLCIVGEKGNFTDQRILSVGIKQGKDLVAEMQRASVVVLPSLAHMESFGMVLIEAMACQTPVVGTNIGGIPEVINDGIDGFIVPPRDSHALAQAISKIVSDKELATRMGQCGQAKVREQFTWDTRVVLTKDVFDTCPPIPRPALVQVVSYYPPHLGGMENCAAQIAEGFADRGYRVLVYTSDIGYVRHARNCTKARVHYLKSVELAHTPVIFSLFFQLLMLPRRSLIHLHISQAYAPEIVFLVSKIRSIPYIAHIHLDVDASGPFGFLLGTYKKLFLKGVLQAAAKIICLSEPQKKLIAAKYKLPLESIVVIPNGVAETYFSVAKTQQNATPHLLFVGRLAVQKNLALLIEALSLMLANVFLDIVGEGEEREHIEALIQKYKLHNVKLHGKKTGQELIGCYQAADIFVLPSFKEGVSLSMLEALAAGLPVVASDLPEIRPILGECGVLIQDPTATNYANALDTLLAKRETMDSLSILAVQKARSYSWENVLSSIEDVYKEVQ